MKLVIVTDAWAPQTNGVVTTLTNTVEHLAEMGHEVIPITPEGFRTIPCPGYKEIRLSMRCRRMVARMLDAAAPDTVHIATEGPLGMAARAWCRDNDFPFVTSLHTRFPEYIRMRAPVPLALSYGWLRRFHAPAKTTLVRSKTQKKLLSERGFRQLQVWPGAVDTTLFRPRGKRALCLPRPISMYMGRVAVEKGLDDFLRLSLPGSKVVIGGGPDLGRLQEDYRNALFLGPKYGEELAQLLSAADVFVFPSRTDTLGLVMLEAMACGVPVAGYPVPGPQDVVRDGYTGALDENLESAVFRALGVNPQACVEYAAEHDWRRSTERFLHAQQPNDPGHVTPVAPAAPAVFSDGPRAT